MRLVKVALALTVLALALGACKPYGEPKPGFTVEIEVDESGRPSIR